VKIGLKKESKVEKAAKVLKTIRSYLVILFNPFQQYYLLAYHNLMTQPLEDDHS
jgi:hypothetical protein